MDSDDETEEIEAKPIVKKSGFAAFQMDDSDENLSDHAGDSDEAPVITKAPEPKKKNKKGKKNDEKNDENDGENMTEAAPAEGENYFVKY